MLFAFVIFITLFDFGNAVFDMGELKAGLEGEHFDESVYKQLKMDLGKQQEEIKREEKELNEKLQEILGNDAFEKDKKLQKIFGKLKKQAYLILIAMTKKIEMGRGEKQEEIAWENLVNFLRSASGSHRHVVFLLNERVAKLIEGMANRLQLKISDEKEISKTVAQIRQTMTLKKGPEREIKKLLIHGSPQKVFQGIFKKLKELQKEGIGRLNGLLNGQEQHVFEYDLMLKCLEELCTAGFALLDANKHFSVSKNRENFEKSQLKYFNVTNKLEWLSATSTIAKDILENINGQQIPSAGFLGELSADGGNFKDEMEIKTLIIICEIIDHYHLAEKSTESIWKLLPETSSSKHAEREQVAESSSSKKDHQGVVLGTTSTKGVANRAEKMLKNSPLECNPNSRKFPEGFANVLMEEGIGLVALSKSVEFMIDQEGEILAALKATNGMEREILLKLAQMFSQKLIDLVETNRMLEKEMPEVHRQLQDWEIDFGAMKTFANMQFTEMFMSENYKKIGMELLNLEMFLNENGIREKLDLKHKEIVTKIRSAERESQKYELRRELEAVEQLRKKYEKIAFETAFLKEFTKKGWEIWTGKMAANMEDETRRPPPIHGREIGKMLADEEELAKKYTKFDHLCLASIQLHLALQNWYFIKSEENVQKVASNHDSLEQKMDEFGIVRIDVGMVSEIVGGEEKKSGQELFDQLLTQNGVVYNNYGKIEDVKLRELLEAIVKLLKYYYAVQREAM